MHIPLYTKFNTPIKSTPSQFIQPTSFPHKNDVALFFGTTQPAEDPAQIYAKSLARLLLLLTSITFQETTYQQLLAQGELCEVAAKVSKHMRNMLMGGLNEAGLYSVMCKEIEQQAKTQFNEGELKTLQRYVESDVYQMFELTLEQKMAERVRQPDFQSMAKEAFHDKQMSQQNRAMTLKWIDQQELPQLEHFTNRQNAKSILRRRAEVLKKMEETFNQDPDRFKTMRQESGDFITSYSPQSEC